MCLCGLLHNQCWVTGMVLIFDYILEDDDYFDFIALCSWNSNLFSPLLFLVLRWVSIRNFKESFKKIYVYFQQFLVIGMTVHISVECITAGYLPLLTMLLCSQLGRVSESEILSYEFILLISFCL